MFLALMRKFSKEEPILRNLLLSTGTCQLAEASPRDSYWGTGNDGKGLNRLGFLLEKARAFILRQELEGREHGSFDDMFYEFWSPPHSL
ncbi:hypothetical protein BGZ94_005546 [Podila epigama]|nr:hypothetical protein BGZ94_005546 [Podila epigama]